MQDSFRKSYIPLHVFGALAVAASVATFKVGRALVLTGAQLSLPTSGTGAGSSTAIVKVNGTAVTPGISVASAATPPVGYQDATASAGAYPAGFALKPGDIVTVDITAVPGTTVPAGAVVYLDVTEVDV